jgi:hypothetical protein
MLLAETRPIVSLNRLSPKVIVRGRTRVSPRNELALYLNLVYILYMCVSLWSSSGCFEWIMWAVEQSS